MNSRTIEAFIRHLITFLGGAGFFSSEDEMTRVVGGLAALIAFAWSWYEKRSRDGGGTPPAPIGPATAVLALGMLWFVAGAVLTGCTTPAGTALESLATPARIQAVTALGAYAGTKAAIAKGHRQEIEEALAGIRAFRASGKADLTSVVQAVSAAGVPIFSDEGRVYIAAGVLIFGDLWDGTAGKILSTEQASAVLAGLEQGMTAALGEGQRGVSLAASPEDLRAAAIATRPAR